MGEDIVKCGDKKHSCLTNDGSRVNGERVDPISQKPFSFAYIKKTSKNPLSWKRYHFLARRACSLISFSEEVLVML